MTIDSLFDALAAAALDGDEYLDHRDGAIIIDGTFDVAILIEEMRSATHEQTMRS